MDSKATDRITLINDVSKLDDAVHSAVERRGPRRIVIFNEKGEYNDLPLCLRDIDIPLEIAGLGCKIGRLDIAGCRSVELEGFDIVPAEGVTSAVSNCRDFNLLKGTLVGRIDIFDVNDILVEGATVIMRDGGEALNFHGCPAIKLSECHFVNPEPKEAGCWCHLWRSAIQVENCSSHGRKPRYGVLAEDNSAISGDHSIEGWLNASYFSWDSLPANVRNIRN